VPVTVIPVMLVNPAVPPVTVVNCAEVPVIVVPLKVPVTITPEANDPEPRTLKFPDTVRLF